ncbi:copper-binding protein [Thioalkalivibrio sulfidiphilus]|uniref:copper-binding protein n=1 Tax=Thioalkalivibrio sulfidiphilus TaxID=1033854 RepID=UPI003B2E8DFD
MKTLLKMTTTALMFGLLALGPAQAGNHGHAHAHGHAQNQSHAHGDAHGAASMAASAGELPKVEAEVRRVNTRANTVSLRHGPITNLDMPAMTMTFKVSDPAQLEGLKPGDKVNVTIDRVDGEYTLMSMEPAQ